VSRPDPKDAWNLVCEWIESDSLRRHVRAVACCTRAYAAKFGADEDLWEVAGLVHDLDYERFPSAETGHPRHALVELERLDYPVEVIHAVAAHADYMGVPRESLLDKTLFAVDELSGFVLACAYVRPQGLIAMTPKSVKKKMKTQAFAAAVNREELRKGAEELGVDFDEHVQFVIDALAKADTNHGTDSNANPSADTSANANANANATQK
jgi:putative nucleotidyltransferase with HDIG domain